jgi:hypothetical protein
MNARRNLIPVILLTFVFAGGAAAGEPMTAAEKESLLAQLDRTSAMLLAAVEGLTPEQWNFKPAPDRWSIADNVEHLVLAESMLRDMTKQAMQEAASAEKLADARKDEMILTRVVDRTTKVKTFEPLEPTGRWASQAEAVEAFRKERKLTKKLAKEGGDLRGFVMDHPVVKDLDAYGNLIFASAHTERHIQQINEVKASDGYPE